MKAWRKHNMICAAKVQRLEQDLDWEKSFVPYTADEEKVKKIQEKIRETKGFRLRNKLERRTHFQAEAHFPSELLLKLFNRVGLPTPMITP